MSYFLVEGGSGGSPSQPLRSLVARVKSNEIFTEGRARAGESVPVRRQWKSDEEMG